MRDKKLTNKDKENVWKEVQKETLAQGFSKFSEKGWSNLGDECWQDLRKATLRKFDKNKQSSSRGKSYNEVDSLVLSILGKDSAVLHSIGSTESGEGERAKPPFDSFASMESSTLENIEEETEAVDTQLLLQGPSMVSKSTKKSERHQIDEEGESEIRALKKKLLEQQIANEKLHSHEIRQNINTLVTRERKDKGIAIFYESRIEQQQPCYSNEAMCYEKLW
uniref:Myb/SANT-like domain-containing protein n=1 Tax=Romanomermis culicivorax TaxID=13658 RepID=A0A915KPB2_ROMCU